MSLGCGVDEAQLRARHTQMPFLTGHWKPTPKEYARKTTVGALSIPRNRANGCQVFFAFSIEVFVLGAVVLKISVHAFITPTSVDAAQAHYIVQR